MPGPAQEIESALTDMVDSLYNDYDYDKHELFEVVRSAIGQAQTGQDPSDDEPTETQSVYDVDPNNTDERGGLLCGEHLLREWGSKNPSDAFVVKREVDADASNPCQLCR